MTKSRKKPPTQYITDVSANPRPKAAAGGNVADIKEGPPHQQRVLDERTDLKDKHAKLSVFIHDNPVFLTLPEAEQQRLQRQEIAMGQYLEILDERIAAFGAAQ